MEPNKNLQPFSHCHRCGTPYAEGASFPKTCSSCNHTHYRNPLPVAVGLVPCEDGLLGVVRGIEPMKGKEALPGGFYEMETPEQACSREVLEETGVQIAPSKWRYHSSFLTPNGNLLTFFVADIEPIAMPPFPPPEIPGVPNETEGFTVIRPGCSLAFSSHTDVAERVLADMAIQTPRPRAARP